MRRDLHMDKAFRREVSDWLRANGIDPMRTPANCHASVADGHLTILQKVQRDGRDVVMGWDPIRGGGEILKETVTVPLQVAPEGDVAEWLEPKCPTCGR